MENRKRKYLVRILILLLVVSCGFNIHQNNKMKTRNQTLKNEVTNYLREFASKCGNINDEAIFRDQYAYIKLAHNAYCDLSGNQAIPQDDWQYNLAGLLVSIESTMSIDKEEFDTVFQDSDICALMCKIANNFEDRDSINKVYRRLNNYKKLLETEMDAKEINKIEIIMFDNNSLNKIENKIITNSGEIEKFVNLFNNAKLSEKAELKEEEEALAEIMYKFYSGDKLTNLFTFNGCDGRMVYSNNNLYYVNYSNEKETPYDLYKESTAEASKS